MCTHRGLLQCAEFKIISFRLQNYFYTTGTATLNSYLFFGESIMFFRRNIRTEQQPPRTYPTFILECKYISQERENNEKFFISTGTYLDLRSETTGQGQRSLLYPLSGSKTEKCDIFDDSTFFTNSCQHTRAVHQQ